MNRLNQELKEQIKWGIKMVLVEVEKIALLAVDMGRVGRGPLDHIQTSLAIFDQATGMSQKTQEIFESQPTEAPRASKIQGLDPTIH